MQNFRKNLETQLDSAQLSVAEHLRGPLCVLAGAGAGKTRAITYRIANAVHQGIARPQNILAVTFTTRAAGEMRKRLQTLGIRGVQVKTFHAAALAQLNYFWPNAIGGRVPEIKENPTPLVAQAAARLGMPTDTPSVRDLRDEIAWAKVQLITPENYPQAAVAAGRTGVAGQLPDDIAQLSKVYEDLKTERGVIDFEDVILILIGLLVDRLDIAKEVRSQYTYFVVDEFQDVSPMQHRLLQLWLGPRKDLCVVGDVSQTIYSFAGASWRYLADFAKYWPGAQTIILHHDYRSTPQIVELANKVIGTAKNSNPSAVDKREPSKAALRHAETKITAHPSAVHLVSARTAGQPVHFQAYPDDAAEARGIVEKIRELSSRGTQLADIAVLYRTNAQSALFETALNDAEIPYTIRGGKRFFERSEVISAMVAFRAAAREGRTAELEIVVTDVLSQLGWRKEAPSTPGASRERWESLDVIRQLAEKFVAEAGTDNTQSRRPDIRAFTAHLEERARYEMEPQLASITLSSLHGAKGLEWPIVFLTGVSEGLLPISHARSSAGVEEERRLFYVGITRAADELYISYAKANLHGKERKASQFLEPIWPKEVSRATQKRINAKERRANFLRDHPRDVDLFEQLRDWRADISRAEAKPPYTIFHDSVLHQIAINKPRTLDELRTVKGVGSLKLSRYGIEILAVVNGYLQR